MTKCFSDRAWLLVLLMCGAFLLDGVPAAAGLTDDEIVQKIDESIANILKDLESLETQAIGTTSPVSTTSPITPSSEATTPIGDTTTPTDAVTTPTGESTTPTDAATTPTAAATTPTGATGRKLLSADEDALNCGDSPDCKSLNEALKVVSRISSEVSEGNIYEKQVTDIEEAEEQVEKVAENPDEGLVTSIKNDPDAIDSAIKAVEEEKKSVEKKKDELEPNWGLIIGCSVAGVVVLIAIIAFFSWYVWMRKPTVVNSNVETNIEKNINVEVNRNQQPTQDEGDENYHCQYSGMEAGGISNSGFDNSPVRSPLAANNTFQNPLLSGYQKEQELNHVSNPIPRQRDDALNNVANASSDYNSRSDDPYSVSKPVQNSLPKTENMLGKHHRSIFLPEEGNKVPNTNASNDNGTPRYVNTNRNSNIDRYNSKDDRAVHRRGMSHYSEDEFRKNRPVGRPHSISRNPDGHQSSSDRQRRPRPDSHSSRNVRSSRYVQSDSDRGPDPRIPRPKSLASYRHPEERMPQQRRSKSSPPTKRYSPRMSNVRSRSPSARRHGNHSKSAPSRPHSSHHSHQSRSRHLSPKRPISHQQNDDRRPGSRPYNNNASSHKIGTNQRRDFRRPYGPEDVY